MNASTPLTTPRPTISEDERARRQREINFARGSVAYEGGVLTDEVEQLNARYIAGEIEGPEHTAAIVALYSQRVPD